MAMMSNDLPPDLKARVLAAASADPSPARPAIALRTALLLTAGTAVAVTIFVVRGGLRTEPRPTALIVETVLGAGLIAAVAAWMALSRGRSMLGRPRAWLLGSAFVAPLALLAWKVAVSASHPGMSDCWVERPGYRCLRLSLAICAMPLAALILVRRGSDPVHPVATGAALGMAAGAFTWVLVDLWCPVAYLPHLLLGHLLPLVLTTLGGALLGWLVIGVRGTRKDR